MAVAVTTNSGALKTHPTGQEITVKDGHLWVLAWKNGSDSGIAAYAPGTWTHAVVTDDD